MRSSNRGFCSLAGALALASCGIPDRPRTMGGRSRSISDLPVKIGPAYQVGGHTYVPKDDLRYDATGQASWYGAGHRGRPTANGERFDPDAISAAHTTLPLPSYVTVTALDTNRTILVRVNDRGPFVAGRIIDLSQGAARLLGVERSGVARVRVRRANPNEADRAALRAGRPASGRGGVAFAETPSMRTGARAPIPASPGGGLADAGTGQGMPDTGFADALPQAVVRGVASLPVAPTSMPSGSVPQPAPAGSAQASHPVSGSPTFYVQVATLADPDRADALASMFRAVGPAQAEVSGSAWCVRLGPYGDEADALSALARARRAGYQDARIVRESAP